MLVVIGRGVSAGQLFPLRPGKRREKWKGKWRIDWEVARADRGVGAARYILHLHMLTDPTTSPPPLAVTQPTNAGRFEAAGQCQSTPI